MDGRIRFLLAFRAPPVFSLHMSDDFVPLTWADLTARPRPEPQAAIAYGDDPWQRVDLWLPDGTGPFPTVLMVHGGDDGRRLFEGLMELVSA